MANIVLGSEGSSASEGHEDNPSGDSYWPNIVTWDRERIIRQDLKGHARIIFKGDSYRPNIVTWVERSSAPEGYARIILKGIVIGHIGLDGKDHRASLKVAGIGILALVLGTEGSGAEVCEDNSRFLANIVLGSRKDHPAACEDNPSRGSEKYLCNIVTWDRERIIRARPEGSCEDNPSKGYLLAKHCDLGSRKDHPSKT
ncbi:MAG: hypothetical protein IPH36_00460 [Saprospiraceae bacterium]|nr:hypothetical protein [Saprospiraceae bacterium]